MKTGMFEGDGFITLSIEEEEALRAAEIVKSKMAGAAHDLHLKGALYTYVRRRMSTTDATDLRHSYYQYNPKDYP